MADALTFSLKKSPKITFFRQKRLAIYSTKTFGKRIHDIFEKLLFQAILRYTWSKFQKSCKPSGLWIRVVGAVGLAFVRKK
jgi:hypothetical protein